MPLTMRRCLLVGWVLLAACAAASAQESGAAEKRAAIKKLLEVGGNARQSQLIFGKLLDRFKGPFAASMIAGLRAEGHFKLLSAEEGVELERRIRVYLDDVFDECKGRVAREVTTPENMEQLTAPAYDKYLTLEEVNQLIAFIQSPLGRRLQALLPEAVAEGVVASMEAKGVFSASPEEMTAKLRQGRKGLGADPAGGLQDVLTASAFAKQLTPDELKELVAFGETPLGRKVIEVYPKLQGEIQANLSELYGRQVGAMLREIYSRKLQAYAVWLSEATRPGAPRGVPPPPSVRLPPPPVVIAPKPGP